MLLMSCDCAYTVFQNPLYLTKEENYYDVYSGFFFSFLAITNKRAKAGKLSEFIYSNN